MNDVKFKALNIPTPPLGYWARVRVGAKVKKTPLSKTQGVTEIIGAKTFEGVKEKTAVLAKLPLEFLSEVV